MVALAQLLADDQLALREVVLPDPDIEVRWVATSELDDPAPYLEGGELLLTTGLATKGWHREWDAYVARLLDAHVAALGLGSGLTHARPPRALVRACESRGLNLIEVPRATPFVAVSRVAARLIGRREEAQARAALEMQRELTAAAGRPDPRSAITQRLGSLVGGDTALVAPDGRFLSGHVSVDLTDDLARIREHGLRGAITTSDAEGVYFLLPVGLSGRPSYYLAAVVPGRPGDGQRGAVTTAVALLSFVADQESQRRETRRALAARALELVAHEEVAAAGVVADAAGLGPLPESFSVIRAVGKSLDEALEALEDRGLLAAVVDGELCALLPSARVPSLAGLRIGVGDSFRTAGLALGRTSDARPVVRWTEVVREGAMALVDPELAATFAQSLLGVLDDTEIETVESFLAHHGSRLQVAEALGIHRNTVRNRVDQIEAKLGQSLDDASTRVSVWLALQARERGVRGGR